MRIKLIYLDTCPPSDFNPVESEDGIVLSVPVVDDMSPEELSAGLFDAWINNTDDHPILDEVTVRDIKREIPSIEAHLKYAVESFSEGDGVFAYVLVQPVKV